MDIKTVKIISYNPYFCNNLIPYFLQGLENNSCEITLLYLLLPIVLHKESRDKLNKAKSNSTIFTIFSDNENVGIENRVKIFEKLTNQSLILAVNRNYIIFENEKIKLMKVKKFDYLKEKDKYIRRFYKASQKFGEIINGHNVSDIFVKLRICQL